MSLEDTVADDRQLRVRLPAGDAIACEEGAPEDAMLETIVDGFA
jgi:hypothetical protein